MKDADTHDFLCSTAWRKKREKILRRDNYQCQIAKRYGKQVQAQAVHHIFPRETYPQYALSDWNLISLSYKAHGELHTEDGQLTDEGIKLLRRTAIKNHIELPKDSGE